MHNIGITQLTIFSSIIDKHLYFLMYYTRVDHLTLVGTTLANIAIISQLCSYEWRIFPIHEFNSVINCSVSYPNYYQSTKKCPHPKKLVNYYEMHVFIRFISMHNPLICFLHNFCAQKLTRCV